MQLAGEHPTPTREQWLDAVDGVLKGKPFSTLVTTLADGIEVQPLYTSVDAVDPGLPGEAPFTRGVRSAPLPDGAWDVRVVASHPDPAVANRVLLDDLDGGATSVLVRGDLALRRGEGGAGDRVGVDGVALHSAEALGVVLTGVHLDLAPVVLQPGAAFRTAADWLREVGVVSGGVGADPLGTLAATGVLPGSTAGDVAALVAELDGTRLRALTIDLTPHVCAGATPVQQLAALLSTAAAHLRWAGIDARAVAASTEVVLCLDADFFAGIAVVRAARRVWGALLAACGVDGPDVELHLHVVTSPRMQSRRDPWVNLLRTTSATFAAGVGGADGVTALTFDAALGVPDELGRRLARNTQLLLQEESHVGAVIDPAGGSAYVEHLTETLAERAWEAFQELERHGGLEQALTSGRWAAELAGSWEARRARVATRRDPLTGVTEFPSVDEAPVVRAQADLTAARAQAARSPEPQLEGSAHHQQALPVHRDAEEVEALRDAADAAPTRPVVLLAALGPVAAHTARVTWARSFFEAGGFATEVVEVTPETIGAALAASGAPLVCLCSSDAVYDAEAAAAASGVAAAQRVYLAGRRSVPGVHESIGVGTDLVVSLTTALSSAGVEL